MTTARNRTVALLVCLLVVGAACSRGEPTTPTATLDAAPSPSEAATPTPTEPADPYAIPADPKDIDAAYVERVLNALMVSIANAVSDTVKNQRVTPSAREAVQATHRGKSLRGITRALEEIIRRDPTGRPFRANAQPSKISVKRVISAGPSCVFTLVEQDTSGLVRQEIEPFAGYYHLAKKAPADDPTRQNPTPWMIVGDAEPRSDGKRFEDPCD